MRTVAGTAVALTFVSFGVAQGTSANASPAARRSLHTQTPAARHAPRLTESAAASRHHMTLAASGQLVPDSSVQSQRSPSTRPQAHGPSARVRRIDTEAASRARRELAARKAPSAPSARTRRMNTEALQHAMKAWAAQRARHRRRDARIRLQTAGSHRAVPATATTGTITGKITDAVTGNPLANNCNVEVYAENAATSSSYYNEDCTDSTGKYTITGVPAGTYTVTFYDSEDGYLVQYYSGKSTFGNADTITVTAGGTKTGVGAALVLGGTVTGTVTSAVSGQPLANDCALQIAAEDSSTFVSYSPDGCTDATGRYTIKAIPTGTYKVQFYGVYDGYLTQYYNDEGSFGSADAISVTAGTTISGINAALTPGGTITGTITDAKTGNPIANNCGMNVDVENSSTNDVYSLDQCTDGSGMYSVGGLPTGTYTVEFSDRSDGYLDQYYDNESSLDSADSVSVAAGMSTSEISAALVKGGTITGTIADAKTGSPLANNCNVQVMAEDTVTFDSFFTQGCTDSSGKYTVGSLPTGSYTVRFSDSTDNYVTQYYNGESSSSSADTVNATGGAATSGINAALVVGGKITGTITDAATGSPLANVCSLNVQADDPTTGAFVASSNGCTDSAGGYSIGGLPAGAYKVFFQDDNHSDNYVSQWYNGKASFGVANTVTVTGGATTSGISAALVTGGTITGTITVAATGNPLANNCHVDVAAENLATQSFSYIVFCTDASGHYTITGLSTGSYAVQFSDVSDNYVDQWYHSESTSGAADPVSVTAGATTSGISAAMVAGGTISGTITDAKSGIPLASNCNVRVDAVNTASQLNYFDGCTDASGGYTITRLPAGTYTVQFQDSEDNYLSQFYSGDPVTVATGATTSGVNVALAAGGIVSGTVTAVSDGHDLSNVCVNVFPASNLNDAVGFGCTGASGTYSIGGLPTGNYAVGFFGSGVSSQYITQYYNGQASSSSANLVSVTAGTATSGINAAMVLGGSISGTVMNTSGTPIAGVCVSAFFANGVDGSFAGGSDACTDSSGHFQTVGLTAGSYQLEAFTQPGVPYVGAWLGGNVSQDGSPSVAVALGTVMSGTNFTLQAGGIISGTVTDAGTGAGLSGVTVCPFRSGANFANCWSTGPDGTYTTAGLADGSYVVQFSGDFGGLLDYVTQYYNNESTFGSANLVTITGASSPTGINAALVQGGAISGTITDATTGNPINDECVHVFQSTGFGNATFCSDSSGHYVVKGLPTGSYTVQTVDEGTSPYLDQTKSALQSVTAGATTSGVNFSLTLGATFSGQVTDAQSGTPLQGVCVSVASSATTTSVCTNASGNYTTPGLPAGSYTLDFTDVGGRYVEQYYNGVPTSGAATPVTVTAGQVKTGINAAMVLGGNVTGVVTAASGGALLPGICVTLEHADGSFAANGGCTGPGGRYTSAGVPAGNYVAVFNDFSGTYATQYYNGSATLAAATPVATTVGSTTSGINAALSTAVPAVSFVSPNTGSPAGGTSVTITGTGFNGATAVTFGGTAATSFSVNSSTQIVATSPARAAGATNVRVTGPGGQSAVVTADQFTYGATIGFTVTGPSGATAGSATTASNAAGKLADAARQVGVQVSGLSGSSETLTLVGSSAYFPASAVPAGFTTSDQHQTLSCATGCGTGVTVKVDDAVAETASLGASDSAHSATSTSLKFNGVSFTVSAQACPTNDINTATNCVTQGAVGTSIPMTVHYAAGQSGTSDTDGAFRQMVVTVTGPSGGGSPSIIGANPATPNTITCTTDATGSCNLVIVDTNPVDTDNTGVAGHKGHDTITAAINATSAVPYPGIGTITSGLVTAGPQAALNITSTSAAPSVSAVSPSSGSTSGATSVTITGTGFTGATAVTFGGTAATNVVVNSATSITATSPAHAAGVTNVRVTTPVGQSAVVTPTDQFTYAVAVAPSVSAVSPSSGSTAGGTSVTIAGTGFTGATAVSFGGVAATNVVVNSSTSVTVTSPAHAAGVTNVRVTGPAGQSAVVTPADQFTYATSVAPTVTSVAPSSGLPAGGTTVTITGTGFTAAATVTFGGTAATGVTFVSSTHLTAVSPAHAAGVTNVRVTTAAGQSAVVTPADQFTYAAAAVPTVSAISPAEGLPGGGTSVTITGTGFTAAAMVSFGGGLAASVTFVSSTELDVESPAHAAGIADVQVTTAAGQSAVVAADQFIYVAAPTITKLSPKSGSTAGGTSVTITGTGFTPDATVSFGSGNAATSVTYVSSTELIAVSPPHSATSGFVNVTVTTGSGTSAVVTADQYKYN
jgi:hypothetical protein